MNTLWLVLLLLIAPRPAQVAPYPTPAAVLRHQPPHHIHLTDREVRVYLLARQYRAGRESSWQTAQTVREVFAASAAAGRDPLETAAVVSVESSWYHKALSPCGARGLTQCTKPILVAYGVTNPYDVRGNLYAGTSYLNHLNSRFGYRPLYLAAYNAGPNRVARLNRVPDILETQLYVRRVIMLHARLSISWQRAHITIYKEVVS
jgi:soluble lytic murein transglycosylase-like protein